MTTDAPIPALTPKQARFVDEYLIDLNATQAAIRAGYSAQTANQQGPRLLESSAVMAAIDARKVDRSEKLKIDAGWILQRLVAEAEADLADLYDQYNNLKPVEEWPLIWRQGLVQGIEVEALFDGFGKDREQIGTVRKIKLDNRVKRLELIGKHIGVMAFKDHIEVSSLNGLADRLARIKEIDDGEAAASVVAATPSTIHAAPVARALVPPPAPPPSPSVPTPPTPHAGQTTRRPAPGDWSRLGTDYRPILEQSFSDVDYDSLGDGLLGSRK